MPFTQPTLQELRDRIAADIETRLPGTDARARRSVLGVLARAHAGAAYGMYGYLGFIARQIMVDTAEAEYLERWAGIWGVTRKAAAQAKGNVTLTGTNGSVVPADTQLQRADATLYTTDAAATIASGTATVAVTAVKGGVAGNAAQNTILSFVSPVSGVNSQATVTGTTGLSGGTDQETDVSLRDRVLARIRQSPHGGAKSDYSAWAAEVAGVTRVWVYPNELGLGTVTVRFMTDDLTTDGIPTAAKVTEVQNYIDALRPVTAALTVVAPVAVALNFTISILDPNTQAVKDAITAELKDLIIRVAEPGGTIPISQIREAISIAAGESDHVLTAPTGNVTHTTGQIATMGTITWA